MERPHRRRARVAVAALLLAPLGATLTYALIDRALSARASAGPGARTILLLFCAEAAGILFVLPVFMWAPRTRRPPALVAMLWGMGVALGFLVLVCGGIALISRLALVSCSATGAAAGLTYWIAAATLERVTKAP